MTRAMLIHHHGACMAAAKATTYRDWAFALMRFAALARGELRDLPGQKELFAAPKTPLAQQTRAQAAHKNIAKGPIA
jgi:hypothetical protein